MVDAATAPSSTAPMLPPYSARLLGVERATAAQALRQRLWQAGLRWPAWIDARPGRLGAIVGDLCDPPLGRHRATLLREHGPLLCEGLAALGLALAAPRLALVVDDPALEATLFGAVADTSIEARRSVACLPSQPALALGNLEGAPWVVAAEELAMAGALLRGRRAPKLCSLVGAVARPQALDLGPLDSPPTPRQLVRQAGGASIAAWVALLGGPLRGPLWPADRPLPAGTTLVYILPTGHPLVARQRRAMATRMAATCLSCRLCTELCPEAPSGTAPHLLLQALARRELRPDQVRAVAGCTGCDACSVLCPADLLPGSVAFALATAARAPDAAPSLEPPPSAAASHLPRELWLRRLDLARYGG